MNYQQIYNFSLEFSAWQYILYVKTNESIIIEDFMKILHTSDLHLGLRLCEYPMNSEIAYLLDQIRRIAKTEECTAVIIAGDIYDRSNPSPESVAIFDGFVTSFAEDGIRVFIISGNHDSPERIAYLSGILENTGVYISPVFDGKIEKITLADEYGDVNFYLLPFFRPSQLRLMNPDFTGDDYTSAHRFLIDSLDVDKEARNIMTAHQFVAGSPDERVSDDEVGGSGMVSADVFDVFDYTALGHLHTAHPVLRDSGIEYCGSPLKCSFAEAGEKKSVTLVDLREKGNMDIRRIPLTPMHDLREIRGTYEYVTSLACREIGSRDDYLRVILTDEDDIPDAVAKLRTVYPNMMRLSYDNLRTRTAQTVDITDSGVEYDTITPESVFAELYELQNNSAADESVMEIVNKLFEISRRGESV